MPPPVKPTAHEHVNDPMVLAHTECGVEHTPPRAVTVRIRKEDEVMKKYQCAQKREFYVYRNCMYMCSRKNVSITPLVNMISQ